MLELVFLLIAAVLFGLCALGVRNWGRLEFLPAGLLFLVLSQLWPHLVLALR